MPDRTSRLARRALRFACGSALVAAMLPAAAAASTASDPAPAEGPALDYWSTKALPPGLPFSEAVQVGELVFLSGQIGILPGTRTLAPGGIREEARQTMENIRSTLAARGYGLDRLVRCTVMLADMAEWETFNEVYRTFFTGRFPARSAFGANGLALGARVEVECVAAVAAVAAVPAVAADPATSPAPMAPAAPPPPAQPAAPAPVAKPPQVEPPAAAAAPLAKPPQAEPPTAAAAPGDAAPAATAARSLAGSSWLLESVKGRKVLSGVEATLDFGDDDTVSGRGPCNTFGGAVEIDGNRIDFGPLRVTRRACVNAAVNQLESDYLGALAKSVRFLRQDDRLELTADDGAVLLRFAPRNP